jgi:Tol biopolymer transport system component
VDSSGAEVNAVSCWPDISVDGRYVAFVSLATNLVAGDTNGKADVFVHDRQTKATERVSIDSAGLEGNDDSSGPPTISADGRFVVFASLASNLVAGDTNGTWDIFVRDRQSQTTQRVSVDSAGLQSNGNCFHPSISADGQTVGFLSDATNLVALDSNGAPTSSYTTRRRRDGTGERRFGGQRSERRDRVVAAVFRGRPFVAFSCLARTWSRTTRTACPTSSCATG